MATPPQFESQNLQDARDCALTRATFNDADLAGAGFSNANIDGLTIFGHDIQALIRAEIARRRGS